MNGPDGYAVSPAFAPLAREVLAREPRAAPAEAPGSPQDATGAPADPKPAEPAVQAQRRPPRATGPNDSTSAEPEETAGRGEAPPPAPAPAPAPSVHLDAEALGFFRQRAATPQPWATAKEVAQALGLPHEVGRVRVILADLASRGLLLPGPGGWRLAEGASGTT